MTTALALRAAPTVDTRSVNLEEHRDAWAGPTAKARATLAAEDHRAPALVSLVWGYLYERSTSTSQHTARAYAQGVRRYVMWAETHQVDILHPDRNTGTAYRAHLERHYGPASAGTRLVAARSLYHALAWVGFDGDHRDPFRDVKAPRDTRPQHLIRPEYEPNIVRGMWNAAEDDLDRLILTLAGGSGLRAQEMLNLRWEHVNLPRRVAFVMGKGAKPAEVYLTDQCLQILERNACAEGPVLLASTLDRDGNPRPISGSTLRYRTARMAARAGEIPSHRGRRPRRPDGTLVDAGPHRLRHYLASSIAERHDIGVAQDALRHSSPATTSRYVHRRGVKVEAFAREHQLGG
jgi:site-specific recombinase XerD